MIFLFTLVEPDNVTKAVFKEEFVTRSISLAFLLFLISPCIPNLRTFEQQVSVCDVMKRICAIKVILYSGALPQGRLASLQWSAEQTEWRRGQKGRDYCGQYCRHQTLLQPPVPRTPGLQTANIEDLNTGKQGILPQSSRGI